MDKAWSAYRPSGGLNTDDDPQGTGENAFPSGDYVYSLNLRHGGADDTNSGGKTNIPGNIVIPDQILPAGTNECIGSYEDVYTPSIIFFNWNSLGDHGIYQYFNNTGLYGVVKKLMVDSELLFERWWTITGINLVENKLLYWVQGFENDSQEIEGNRPRKLNVIKADDVGKFRTYQVIFDYSAFEAPYLNAVLNIIVYDPSGTAIEGGLVYIPLPQVDYMAFLEAFAAQINTFFTNITAEACDCGLNITLTQEGEWTIGVGFLFQLSGGGLIPGASITYATNFYPSPLIQDHINRIKRPPQCEPNLTFLNDATQKQNLLIGHYFQFAVRHRFDDGEKSVKGAISELGYVTLPCGYQDTDSPYNFIRVDFTSEELVNPSLLAVLTGVDLLMRDGNNGLWKLVQTFDRCELDVTTQYFDFYNDGNYPVLDDIIQAELQHDVPLIGMSQEFVTDRGFVGGGLIGFDNLECPEGHLELTYEPEDDCLDAEMATITFRIYIHNPHDTGLFPEDNLYQPIYASGEPDEDTTPRWGGMSEGFTDNVGTRYDQWLYNRGFRVYSAGTAYSAYSIQHTPDPSYGITYMAGVGNIFDAGTIGKRDAIRAAMADGDVYSEVTISVPAGTHILRFASHLLQDLDDNSPYDANAPFAIWQKSSTYVDNMCQTNTAEIIVTVAAGETLVLPDTYMMDLKDTSTFYSVAYSGYLIDGETITTQPVLFASPRMERQITIPTVVPGGSTPYFSYNNDRRTDHNGFWFGTIGGLGPIPGTNNVRFISTSQSTIVIHNTTDLFYEGDLDNLSAGTCTSISTLDLSNEHKPFIIYNLNMDVSNFCRTYLQGKVVFSDGAGVIGATVLFGATDRVAVTDSDGEYSILVYVDTFNNQRNNYLVFKYDAACCVEFGEDGDKMFVSIPQFVDGGNYSIDYPYRTIDFLLDILGVNVEERLKKRNKIILGIVYTDGYQFSKVQHWEDWEIYIPFLTEPEGNPGIPKIEWFINHPPPSWATHYYIVRQKNPVYERQLQFIINKATYIIRYNTDADPTETSFSAGDANLIQLDLDTLVFYKDENTDSIINFIPQENDRVTFMEDPDGVVYTSFYDYRILSGIGDNTPTTPLSIVIKYTGDLPEILPGTLIELWTPKLQTEEAPYFEIMECYEIIETAYGKVHGAGYNGQAQNLDPLATQPATGFLKHGDCYVRDRRMLTKDVDTDPDTITYYDRKIESFYINDWDVNSLQLPIGRVFVEDKEWAQLFQRTRVWWSGVYVAQGNVVVNDYSRFVHLDYKDLEREYGTIMRLIRVGEVTELLSIHRYKIQPIYVGFKPLYDMTGETVVGKTAEILTPGQAIINMAGTENPESIFTEGNYVYGWSTFFGIWWRYSGNGVQDITTGVFKVQKLGKRKSSELRRVSIKNSKIFGVYDRDKEEAIWAFQSAIVEPDSPIIPDTPIEIIPAETISFSEKRNRWETNYGYFPDAIQRLGKQLYSFKAGLLKIHEKNPLYNNFNDIQSYSQIEYIVNPDPQSEKNIFSMRITPALEGWSAPDVFAMPTDITPSGMHTRISANNIKTYRASKWADFFRDYTDPAFDNELDALFNGRDMMGRVFKNTLKNTSTKQVYLSEVNVSIAKAEQTI